MQINPFQKTIRILLISIAFSCFISALLFAQEVGKDSLYNENVSILQEEARDYRARGLEFQRIGNLDEATAFYQKAVQLDPAYAMAYNDLGIIYEQKGDFDQAESTYLACIKRDPSFLAAYTNLASLYESKRDLKKAAFYWNKRVKLGFPDDPWTQKAKSRLRDVRAVVSENPAEDAQQEDVVGLLKDVTAQKAAFRKDDVALSKDYFNKAKVQFKKGNNTSALKLSIDAIQLDPSNSEIEQFIEKVQARLLSH